MKGLCKAGVCVVVLAGLCFGQSRGRTGGGAGRGGATPASAVDPNAPKGVFPTSHGVVRSNSGSQLLVEVDGDHEIKFRMTRKTKIYAQSKDAQGKVVSKEIKASSLEPGQTVDIDMQSSLDGSFEAVHVTVLSADAAPAAAETQK